MADNFVEMEQLLSEFLDYLRFELRRSDCTVDSYSKDLSAFVIYVRKCDDGLSWETIDSDIIRGWMERMMDAGNAAASINRRLSSLRTFYRFALSRKKVTCDPVYWVKGPKKAKPLPQYLREDEMDRLLDSDAWGRELKDVRARAIVLTFYSTGVRLSELVGLDDSAIDYNECQLKVRGKRNKERIIPFGAELAEVLRGYQLKRGEIPSIGTNALFVTDKGLRMTPAQVRKLVQENLSKVCTLKKRTPHVLRHTFATAMLNNDSGLESVQKLLGHESLTTTEIYTHTTFEQLRKVYQQAHPRGGDDQSEK